MDVTAAQLETLRNIGCPEVANGGALGHAAKFSHREPQCKSDVLSQRDDDKLQGRHVLCMGETFGENLRDARKLKGWSQARLANEAQLESKGYISALESGKRPMPPGRTLEALASALDVDVSDLVGPATRTTVPVVGYVQAGAEAILYADGQGPFDEVPAPHNATPRTVALQSRGESLGPLLSEWLVYYDDVHSPITANMHGRLCVLGLPDGRVVVKQLKPASGGRYHLISQNEGPMLDQEVSWGAIVTAMTPR